MHNPLCRIQASRFILKPEAENDGLFLEMFNFGKYCFKLSLRVATFTNKYDQKFPTNEAIENRIQIKLLRLISHSQQPQ